MRGPARIRGHGERGVAGLGIAAPRIAGSGGIAFSGKLEDAWRVNLGAGTVSRVLMRLDEFKATGFRRVPREALRLSLGTSPCRRCPGRFFHPGGPFAAVHEGKLAEEAARAITERLAAYGRQTSFPEKTDAAAPGRQTVFLRVDENRCQASLDMSGELLYKRGHGKCTETAPCARPWPVACCAPPPSGRYRIVIDPFCGSGTFALEAAAIFPAAPSTAAGRSPSRAGRPSGPPASVT